MRGTDMGVTMAGNAVPQQSGSNAKEIQQAIQDAAQAARDAGNAARDAGRAARDQARAARTAAQADGGPARSQGGSNATIVIPSDNGEDVTINVDGGGIHVRQGDHTSTIPIRDVVPRGAVQMTYAVCATLVAVAFVSPLMRFFLRRYERRATSATISAAVQARLDAMDRNIDTVAVELERVSEGQRFTAKLLEQRPMEHAQRIDR